jgi:hypothetical protein
MQERRCSSASAADLTRPPRHGLIDHQALVEQWRSRAEVIGFAPPAPIRPLRRQPAWQRPPRPSADEFTRADLVRAVGERLRDGAPVATVERLAETTLSGGGIVALPTASRRAGPARLDGPNGQPDRFTSEDVGRHRRALLEVARVDVVIRAGGIDAPLLASLGSPGHPTVLVTRSPLEARRLEAETGRVAAPMAQMIGELRRWPATHPPVVVVQRAHRVPTAALAALSRRTAGLGGRTILVGEPDPHHWSETFHQLATRRTIELPGPTTAGKHRPGHHPRPAWLEEAIGPPPPGLSARALWHEAASELSAHGPGWQQSDGRARRRLEQLVAGVALAREGPVLGLR